MNSLWSIALQPNEEGISPTMRALELGLSHEVIELLVERAGKEGVMHQDSKGRHSITVALETGDFPITIRYLAIITGVDAILQENNTSIYNEKMCKKIICWMGRNL